MGLFWPWLLAPGRSQFECPFFRFVNLGLLVLRILAFGELVHLGRIRTNGAPFAPVGCLWCATRVPVPNKEMQLGGAKMHETCMPGGGLTPDYDDVVLFESATSGGVTPPQITTTTTLGGQTPPYWDNWGMMIRLGPS